MKRSARLILAVAATAAILPQVGARAATINVSIRSGGGEFHPSEIVVHVGDYVRWTNDDHTVLQTDHNVMADDGSFSSKQRMKEGTSFEFQFTAAGTFAYHCTIHGWGGTVDVVGTRPTRAATASPTPTATRTTRPKASKSATASATPDASPDASSEASVGASGVGGSLSSSAGAIISIAIVSIVALALLGWFVYVRFVRQD